ncbi:MAG: hypothetical protein U0K38_01565, partial [Collinsella sp.]|nr:hypothetical protein [Collinsella sp.]
LETEHGFLITSPLLTAFIMSRHLTDLQLLLVLAEMCGLFAVCALPVALEAELTRAIDSGAISTTFGWVRCPSEDGTASYFGVETLWFWAETLTVFVQMFAGCVTAIDLWRYRNLCHWAPRRLLRSRRICCLHCREPWEAKGFAT